MKKTGIIIGVLVLIVVAVLLKTNTNKNTETIKIGGAFILTGPAASVGELQKNAATMAVDEVNKTGGINGKKVELVMEDSAYDPKTALNAYQALKLKGIHYVVADGSPVLASIRELAVKDGNLIFASGATSPSYFDHSPLSCRLALTAKNFAPGYTTLLQKRGYKKVAVFFPDNEAGQGLLEEFKKTFPASGGTIVTTELYNAGPTGGDYRTNIAKLVAKQKDVDAMILLQVGNTIEAMFKQLTDLGWKKPIISEYYTVQNPSLKNLSLANGIDFVDYEYSRDSLPNESAAAKKFKSDYSARFGSTPVYLAAGHYDTMQIIFEAIKNVGDSPEKVAEYITHIKNREGVTGTVSFDDDCEVSRNVVFRTVKDGKIVDLQ